MDRRKCAAILLVAVAASWAVRLNNALTYPSLRAFDGFGHFTYIWFMADHWRVPPPTSGWSFFHPPMYYWLMASIWRLAESLDPLVRLKIGTALTSTLGLAHGLVIYAVVRRRFPDKPLIALLSATLMLFLPVQVFTAGYLGNEYGDGIESDQSGRQAGLRWLADGRPRALARLSEEPSEHDRQLVEEQQR